MYRVYYVYTIVEQYTILYYTDDLCPKSHIAFNLYAYTGTYGVRQIYEYILMICIQYYNILHLSISCY